MTLKQIIMRMLPDRLYLSRRYYKVFHRKLNLRHPKSFNEKIQWMKLYDRRSEYTTLVDKYAVKRWVSDRIGVEYVIPTLGVWNQYDDIDFDALPDQYVLKCTHDSGSVVICKEKSRFNHAEAKEKLETCLHTNFYLEGREWPYKNVMPRILAEKYMEDSETKELRDYKLFCFNGVVKALLIATNRQNEHENVKMDFFDRDFHHLELKRGYDNASQVPNKPYNFEKMIKLAEVLSSGYPEIRVDFYEANEQVYFGELTLFPGCGFVLFEPEKWDYIFGSWIELPKITKA